MRLADMPSHGDWIVLGEDPPHEIAFGVIGQFWAGEIVWAQIDATDFETFTGPGFGKIACNFSLWPDGADRTLVTYECRTLSTDETASRGFMRYWRHWRHSSAWSCAHNCGSSRRRPPPARPSGYARCAGPGTGREQEQVDHRSRSFPGSDTARDPARAGAQTPNAQNSRPSRPGC